jgi:hypothetical protein
VSVLGKHGRSDHRRRREGQKRRHTCGTPLGSGFEELPPPFDAMPVSALLGGDDLPIALHEQYPTATVIGKVNVHSRRLEVVV